MRKLFILFSALFYMGVANSAVVYWTSSSNVPGWYNSPDPICAALLPFSPQYRAPTRMVVKTTGNVECQASWSGGWGTTGNVNKSTVADCPAGQVYQEGVTAKCGPAPVVGPKCEAAAGADHKFTLFSGKSNINAETSDAGSDPTGAGFPTKSPTCGIVPGSLSLEQCYTTPNADGLTKNYYCTYSGKSDGTNAPAGGPAADSGPASTPKTPAKDVGAADEKGTCPKGTVQAGVGSDGIPVCMGTGTNPGGKESTPAPTSTTTKETDAAGNATETTKTVNTNADGSTTTTTVTTTTAPDGTRTVTGGTTTSAATNGGAGQQDKPADDFCKLHPELTACRNSSVAGSCGTISCTGDAIQCATLRAAAAMQCAQEADTKAVQALPSKALGDSILAGSDPQKASIDAMIKGTEVDLSKPMLDQSGFIGGGSCLSNKTFTVMGQSVAVDFTRLCTDIQPIRAIIMAVAFIAAYMIVSRSVLTA